jgi:hypothetical protein
VGARLKAVLRQNIPSLHILSILEAAMPKMPTALLRGCGIAAVTLGEVIITVQHFNSTDSQY